VKKPHAAIPPTSVNDLFIGKSGTVWPVELPIEGRTSYKRVIFFGFTGMWLLLKKTI
jgi:hypothetical protein